MKATRQGKEVTLVFDSKDPILKEIATLLKRAGRGEDCRHIEQAAKEDPPEIDPGG